MCTIYFIPVNNQSLFLFFSSSLVDKILKDAHDAGKKFTVIVVDSRPKLEGNNI